MPARFIIKGLIPATEASSGKIKNAADDTPDDFQDSGSSLNQRMKVRDIIEEPMRVQKIRPLRGSYEEEARFQMKYVGLDPEYLKNIRENCPADSGSALRLHGH